MKQMFGLAAALVVMLPSGAFAQEPKTIIGGHGSDRFRFGASAYYHDRRLSDDSMSLNRRDVSVDATVYALPWLGIYAGVHFGQTDFSFRYPLSRGFILESEATNRDLSLKAGARAGLAAWGPLTLEVFMSYEVIPYRSRFGISSARLETPLGQYDITEFCRQHADFRYNLSQLSAGGTVHVRIWRFVPRLGAQYQRLSASFDPRLDDEAAKTIGLLGFDAEKAKKDLSGIKHVPAISFGLFVELPHDFGLDVELATVPTETSNFLTLSAGVSWRH